MTTLEGFRLPLLNSKTRAQATATWVNLQALKTAHARGKGVCLVGAHLGSYEQAGCALPHLGFVTNIIYRDIHFEPASEFWNHIRRQTGIKAISPRRSRVEITEALGRGEIVVFAADQHMPAHRGIVTEFLGCLASTMTGPARFALDTGAAIITAHAVRDPQQPWQHTVIVDDESTLLTHLPGDQRDENIRFITEGLNRFIERWIRQTPNQWLWHHRRFKVDDAPEKWTIPENLRHLTDTKINRSSR